MLRPKTIAEARANHPYDPQSGMHGVLAAYQHFIQKSRRNCSRCNTLVAVSAGLILVSIALFGTVGIYEWAAPFVQGWLDR
ncbi:hypothetical protein AWB68_06032 [Caballeronia choica]|jgi:hypothetical protein|uniref:Uncharacterized protein n=1 Tax=Caballeronia choica TaxID=326476 RepID=A0A158KIZ6_9BURK|nr:hypothetical protein AWB68_06032 [Caballeronia choica]